MVSPRDLLPPNYADLLLAGVELVRAEFLGPIAGRLIGLESISSQAGQLLFESGRAQSREQGIVIFHHAITQDKPALRRVLRRVDERAGRVPRKRRSPAQKVIALAVKAGEVKRSKNGQIVGLTTAAKQAVKKAQRATQKKRNEQITRKQKTAKAKLKGFTVAKRKRGR